MARLLIREAHGGETRIIRDGGLPYFLNQGWVVLDTLDDEDDASPLYLSKAEGDLRWARISDLGDPESAEGVALRAAFVSFGPDDPEPSLPPGTEYVWNKTDGAGTLIDIITGVAA